MALLQTGKWYRVAFKHTNDPAWAALPIQMPMIQGNLVSAIVNNEATVIYVIDSNQGTFAMYGTTIFGWHDTLLLGASELSSFDLTTEDGVVTHWARGVDSVYFFDEPNGTLRRYSNKDAGEFAEFLP